MNAIDKDPKAGTIRVRLAQTQADLAAMIALGEMMHAEGPFYRNLPLDEERMREIGRRGLTSGNPGLIIAERDGHVLGMAVVVLGEHFFSPILAATSQLVWHPSGCSSRQRANRIEIRCDGLTS